VTLNQIITAALERLGRTTDSQQQDEWSAKFTRMVNDGIYDLATYLKLRRTDPLPVEAGEIDVDALPYRCLKVLGVEKAGVTLGFSRGSATAKLKVPAECEVSVEYRYIPNNLSSDTDVPGIPERLHWLLVSYVCAREYQSADENTQRRANLYFQEYQEGKAVARETYGEAETYAFINTGW